MSRRFRPLQESVEICVKMLAVALYYGDSSEIEYWRKRYNGYMKLAQQKGVQIKVVGFAVEEAI